LKDAGNRVLRQSVFHAEVPEIVAWRALHEEGEGDSEQEEICA
jgi:hypothetical protein